MSKLRALVAVSAFGLLSVTPAALAAAPSAATPRTAAGTRAPGAAGTVRAASAPGPGSVTGGGSHFCVHTGAGGAKCWGYNSSGGLGDGSTTHAPAPVDVSGFTSGLSSIDAGGQTTCAVTDAGGAKCWGLNNSGQVGDGSHFDRLTPVDVSGLTSGVAAVSVGYYHACALTTGGGVKCWGDNGSGQLGDGTNVASSTPVDVEGLTSGVTAIATGLNDDHLDHTCALAGGGVKCWGDNTYGQLGDGTTTSRSEPVDVIGLTSGVSAISAGGTHTSRVPSNRPAVRGRPAS